MPKKILYVLIFILLASLCYATPIQVNIEHYEVGSFAEIVKSSKDIYVGSNINYSITLGNNNDYDITDKTITISIYSPNGQIIYVKNATVNISSKSELSINSQVTPTEYELIDAITPGLYSLVLDADSSFEFYRKINYEDGPYAFKHNSKIPLYFEVKSLEELRTTEINQKMFYITIIMLLISIVQCGIAIIQTKGNKVALTLITISFILILFFSFIVIFPSIFTELHKLIG